MKYNCFYSFLYLKDQLGAKYAFLRRDAMFQKSIGDARTPQPGEIVFNTMRYRSSETVQSSRYFQSSVSYI